MPLSVEYRLFFLNGKFVACLPYWEEGKYGAEEPDLDLFKNASQGIKSNFFTLDVAKKKNGAWIIIEPGDGQVAGLPDSADRARFYERLSQIIGSE